MITGHTMVLPLIILIFTLIRKISSIVDRTYGISVDGVFNGMIALELELWWQLCL